MKNKDNSMEEFKSHLGNRGMKVLVVDDVPDNIQIIVHFLKENGLTVNYADSGVKALKAIKNNLPDLILLDISMPDMSGLEVCEKLKGDELTAKIPIIFLTARAGQQDVVQGLEKGAVDYITKPFNAKELISRVFIHLELKFSRDQISKQNAELNRLNGVKDQLFSLISHDIKNLFSNILFGTESLEKESEFYSKEEIVQIAGIIKDSAQGAFSLLQNLLDWSRIQMQNNSCNPTLAELGFMVNQAIGLLKPLAQKKNIELNVSVSGENFEVYTDIEMTKSVIRNILSNAIKYSYPNGKIDIFITASPENVKVKIQDYGVGMSIDQINKLKNEEKPTNSLPGTRNEKGSGLGLMLIRDFVEKCNGTFDFNGEPGKGSEFWFTLPRMLSMEVENTGKQSGQN